MAAARFCRDTIVLSLLFTVSAQIGTQHQDLTTAAGYRLQKSCAKDCFVYDTGGSCPRDTLGEKIGCSEWECNKKDWSMNDCYCRPDLQNPAQEYLTSCISTKCEVGDWALDASTAGSIYSQYCKDKGYVGPTAPARVQATATRDAGVQVQTTGEFANPTSSSTTSSSSSSTSLPITTIVGIVVGSLVALVIAGIGIKMLVACVRRSRTPKPQAYPQYSQPPPSYQPPVYPSKPFSEHHFYSPPPESELTPDDSRSVVSGTAPGFAPMAPTLISGEHGHHQYVR